MYCRLFVFALFVSLVAFTLQASAQAPAGGGDSTQKPAPQVASDAPVITIEEPCPTGATTGNSSASAPDPQGVNTPAMAPVTTTPSGATCKIVVTRAQFELLADAIHRGQAAPTLRYFAERYADSLVLVERAHESGFDADPVVAARERLGYLTSLSQNFTLDTREKARLKVSDADVETYYKAHPDMFEQVELMRVFIPSIKEYNTGSSKDPAVLAVDKTELEAAAKKLYKEAVAGANFEKLEERAYKLAGNPEDTPPINMGNLTRNQVPEEHRDLIFGLKTGELSQLVPESNGWSIFKVVSRRTLPLSEAKPLVQQLKSDAAIADMKKSAKIDLNNDYFAAPPPSTAPPRIK